MPAVLVDVGYHLVEPNTSGQTVSLTVVSTEVNDPPVAGLDLRAQIVTTKDGPSFEEVRFAGSLWNSHSHVESGGPFPANPTLASGEVAFTQGSEARADGTLVTLTINTTGIPAGSYEFRLVGTQIGSSSFHRADGSGIGEVITNGTLQVRSIWQNPDNPHDINGDGRISPLDVLLLLNELSKKGSYELQMPSPGEEPTPYFDVNGDGHLSPKDPLGIINCLNGLSCVSTPTPILAQVTPGFPDATGGEGTTGGDGKEPEDTSPGGREECIYEYFDKDGNPLPEPIPIHCISSESIEPAPVPVEQDESNNLNSVPESALGGSRLSASGANGWGAWGAANNGLAGYPTSKSVDAVIVSIADELTDEDTSDDLIELGLGYLFAVS